MSTLGQPRSVSIAFVVGVLVGAAFALFWRMAGEPWEFLADGAFYLRMAAGEAAESPFGFRFLSPLLASVFPSRELGFAVVTTLSLVLTSGALAALASLAMADASSADRASRARVSVAVVAAWLWGLSFAFAYYATTLIRVDPLALLAIAAAILLARLRARWWVIALVLAVGVWSHETALVALVGLWADKLLGGTLTGGAGYRASQLALVTLCALGALVFARVCVSVLPASQPNYIASPLDMVAFSLNYSGGIVKHALRLYAAFGPALVFALAFAVGRASLRDGLVFTVWLVVAAALSFLATDTLRVMSLAFVPVLAYAAGWMTAQWREGRRILAALAFALQAAYAWLAFAHLRTFESSSALNAGAIAVSVLAALIAFASLNWRRLRERANRST